MDRREAAAAPSKPFRLPIQPLRLPKSWQHPRRMEEPMAHSCIRRSPGCFVPPNPPCMSWPRKRQSRCFFPGFLLTQEGHCVGSCFRRKDTGAAHKGPGLLLTQEGHLLDSCLRRKDTGAATRGLDCCLRRKDTGGRGGDMAPSAGPRAGP